MIDLWKRRTVASSELWQTSDKRWHRVWLIEESLTIFVQRYHVEITEYFAVGSKPRVSYRSENFWSQPKAWSLYETKYRQMLEKSVALGNRAREVRW